MAKNERDTKKLQEKKDKVMLSKAKLSLTTVAIVLMVVAMAVGGFWLYHSGTSETRQAGLPKRVGQTSVSGPVDYTAARVDMTNIEYKTVGNNVVISLSEIKKNKIARFEFHSPKINDRQKNFAGEPLLPVLALVRPSGKLMVGVSYCEPCRSTTFHTESDLTLTCNKCGTKWDLESLTPQSGSPDCQRFPPDEIKVTVKGDKVIMAKEYLESWEPREQM